MSSNEEEQEMEAQALEAIFDQAFTIVSKSHWTIEIYPEQNEYNDDTSNGGITNYVGCKLVVTLPDDYPELSVPQFDIEIIKGLADEHRIVLIDIATNESETLIGTPCIFAIVEKIREWLIDNNVKGLDDISMHAIMMRKEREKQEQLSKASQQSTFGTIYESHHQTTEMEMTQAEMEELIVTKRRAEGTPCTKENFLLWQEKFDTELQSSSAVTPLSTSTSTSTNTSNKAVDKTGRLTGYQYFSDKSINYEALEAAAERAEMDYNSKKNAAAAAAGSAAAGKEDKNVDGNDDSIDEELFDDDVDVDDLSFDDDDDDDDEDDDASDDDDVNI